MSFVPPTKLELDSSLKSLPLSGVILVRERQNLNTSMRSQTAGGYFQSAVELHSRE